MLIQYSLAINRSNEHVKGILFLRCGSDQDYVFSISKPAAPVHLSH